MASNFNAAEILSIQDNQPEKLFPYNDDDAKTLFKQLASRWHPDVSGGVTEVFQKINALYDTRKRMIEAGTWMGPGEVVFDTLQGKPIRIRYLKQISFELGQMLIGRTSVAYVIKKSFEKLARNGIDRINSFKFADAKMESEMKRFLPKILKTFDTRDSIVIILEKNSDLISLREVMDYYDQKIDPQHVAWIISSLNNMACYLQWAKTCHNAISPDTYFISPQHHSGILLGGWWYALPVGSSMTQVPAYTFNNGPRDTLKKKQATLIVDHSLIRAIARELLGDISGGSILRNKSVPPDIALWATLPGSGNAMADYKDWCARRDKSYPRKFVKMDLDPSKLYQ